MIPISEASGVERQRDSLALVRDEEAALAAGRRRGVVVPVVCADEAHAVALACVKEHAQVLARLRLVAHERAVCGARCWVSEGERERTESRTVHGQSRRAVFGASLACLDGGIVCLVLQPHDPGTVDAVLPVHVDRALRRGDVQYCLAAGQQAQLTVRGDSTRGKGLILLGKGSNVLA